MPDENPRASSLAMDLNISAVIAIPVDSKAVYVVPVEIATSFILVIIFIPLANNPPYAVIDEEAMIPPCTASTAIGAAEEIPI